MPIYKRHTRNFRFEDHRYGPASTPPIYPNDKINRNPILNSEHLPFHAPWNCSDAVYYRIAKRKGILPNASYARKRMGSEDSVISSIHDYWNVMGGLIHSFNSQLGEEYIRRAWALTNPDLLSNSSYTYLGEFSTRVGACKALVRHHKLRWDSKENCWNSIKGSRTMVALHKITLKSPNFDARAFIRLDVDRGSERLLRGN